MKAIKILVAIANHGTKNKLYLDQLLAAYRAMPVQVSIVVLSNITKDLGPDIEVRVGLPSLNPWSLPFAHRQLFVERLDDFDYFIYTEDDTLLTWEVMQACINSTTALQNNEIAGFIRMETGPDGARYYSTCHSFFRWIPSSVRERGGHLWARYSNEHAACYVISQEQLRHSIDSGGFSSQPHEGRHDMLCAAATDVYTQCGLERLVCIDSLEKFTLPHLPNKYIGKMGLPTEEMAWQVATLRRIFSGELSDYELLNPETLLPGGVGSKFYREPPDQILSDMVGKDTKRVLVWGSGDGIFEADLVNQGHDVAVIPLDEVVGESCRRRGLNVRPPDFFEDAAEPQQFDIVILRDVLHLHAEPLRLLTQAKSHLRNAGSIVVRVPNLLAAGILKQRLRNPRFKIPWTRESLGAIPFSAASLRKTARSLGFREIKIRHDVPLSRTKFDALTLGLFSRTLSPYLYLSGKVK